MTLPEDRNFKFTQSAKVTNKKKMRKGKKKEKGIKGTSSTTQENKDKRLSSEISPLLCPQEPIQIQEQLPKPKASKKKNAKHRSGRGQKSKTHQKHSQAMVELTDDTSSGRTMAHETGLGMQARESLRWEGVLQDPQEEAKRLEQYRANRRQRYIAHREALLRDTQQADPK